MKKQESPRFSLDWRNIIQVLGALFIGMLSIYATNTELFNKLLQSRISPEEFIVITGVLSYLAKKYITNYSNK